MLKRGILAWLLVCAPSTIALAATDADKCEAAKNKVAGKYAFCRHKAVAKAIKTGDPVDYSKCDAKYAEKWASAETKGEGMCPTNGDLADMQAQLTGNTDVIALKLAGVRFVDNGDGTVTDIETGLMWEKKNNLGGIHNQNNLYLWCDDVAPADGACDNGGVPDGPAFWTFLGTLNNGTSGDGSTISGCFADHCDWRLPTIAELQTILLAPFPCGTSPCIDSIFGSTQSFFYWSATSEAGDANSAWAVDFDNGNVGNPNKTGAASVRAVRGGL